MENKLAIGIYYVIGYGTDCDGYSSFKCVAFVNEKKANEYCNSQNEASDGVRYIVTSDMRTVQFYCDDYLRDIPLAVLDEDDIIKRNYTYVYN